MDERVGASPAPASLRQVGGFVMNGQIRGHYQPGGWKQFDLLMLGLSVATVVWILIGH
jgi:hypothetical protein